MALDLPASAFSAGSGLGGRELTAAEESAFQRRRRNTRLALAALVIAVPVVAVLVIGQVMKPSVDRRTRSFANGSPEVVAEYVDAKKNGAFTEYYGNGKKKADGHYRNDVEDGHWVRYFWNGAPESEGDLARGV